MRAREPGTESQARLEAIRDAAVAAVMRYGRFETSGETRLAVLRLEKLMIAYHTPFNPLPPLNERAKYAAAKEGKCALLQPYGIDIWQVNYGRVLSIGWREGAAVVIDLYRSGRWERFLDDELIRAAGVMPDSNQDSDKIVGEAQSAQTAKPSRPRKAKRPAQAT